jgi:hypothetical protein
MVQGVLYMFVRNAGSGGEQCQLAWSSDYASTWTWASWKFEEFGYLTIVNYGKNYSGARDNYVYLVTPNGPDAYNNYDSFVLLRVHKDSIRTESAYQFYSGTDPANPQWSSNIAYRKAVFTQSGRCWRSSVSYNPAIGRYIWWQLKMDDGGAVTARYDGGLGVFEAPEPWGPWRTAFYVEMQQWDKGAGETGCFPTKWMSQDGKTMHMVSATDDCFAVRACTLTVAPVIKKSFYPESSNPERIGLKLYPNPVSASGSINLCTYPIMDNMQLGIYTCQGRLLRRLNGRRKSMRLAVPGLNLYPGTYAVILYSGDDQATRTLTVVR